MNDFGKNYLIGLLGFSKEKAGVEMKFKDPKSEELYRISDFEKENKKSIIFCLLSCLTYIFLIVYLLFVNNFKPVYSVIMYSCNLAVEPTLAIINNFYKNNFVVAKFMKYLRFFLLYTTFCVLVVFPVSIKSDLNMRFIYGFLLIANLVYIYKRIII